MTYRTAIVWFRRDLRLSDQPALVRACREAGRVIPLFVCDPRLLAGSRSAGPRRAFLFASLRELAENLRARGSSLVVRSGDPCVVLPALIVESGADAVYFNRDYAPAGRQRDDAVLNCLQRQGTAVHVLADHLLVEPDTLLTRRGTPFTVFTPYYRAWLRREPAQRYGEPPHFAPHDIVSEAIPEAHEPGNAPAPGQAPAGERAGKSLLEMFVGGDGAPIRDYKHARDFPAVHGTSKLSPHLRFGTVGIRAVVAAARQAGSGVGVSTWLSELAWREFYYQWLWHFPWVARHSFLRQYDQLGWTNDAGAIDAWRSGQTGFPIVDAAMRQMNQTGWMHNRLRMIVACFLSKDMLVDWRIGEQYFWERLVDGDRASNLGGWQWSASVGVDPQPYFRIFNPRLQSERFDPDGTFIRTWLPELSRLPAPYIHVPHLLPSREALRIGFKVGRDYPLPILDHAWARERVLAAYAAARGSR